MQKIIRPFLKLDTNAPKTLTPEQAVALIKKCNWVTMTTRDDIVKTMLLLGWSPDEIAYSVSYALHGAPHGASVSF